MALSAGALNHPNILAVHDVGASGPVGGALNGAAVSPSGRLVATAFGFGQGEKTLRIWGVETGELRLFDLPEPASATADRAGAQAGWERGVEDLHFADESTLYTAGHGGILRWDLQRGAHELVAAKGADVRTAMAVIGDGRSALTADHLLADAGACSPAELHDLSTGESRELPAFGECVEIQALGASGDVVVTGDIEGIVRVGRVTGGEPHQLVGHEGPVDSVAVSPDLRWVASTGEDDTLRLWPMPDLSQPALHTLPRAELLAKLRSLTNLRVARDAETPDGWKVDLGPFPGWREVPSWFTPASVPGTQEGE